MVKYFVHNLLFKLDFQIYSHSFVFVFYRCYGWGEGLVRILTLLFVFYIFKFLLYSHIVSFRAIHLQKGLITVDIFPLAPADFMVYALDTNL